VQTEVVALGEPKSMTMLRLMLLLLPLLFSWIHSAKSPRLPGESQIRRFIVHS